MLYKVFDQETSALRSICYARPLAYGCTRQCEIVSPRMLEDDHTVLLYCLILLLVFHLTEILNDLL